MKKRTKLLAAGALIVIIAGVTSWAESRTPVKVTWVHPDMLPSAFPSDQFIATGPDAFGDNFALMLADHETTAIGVGFQDQSCARKRAEKRYTIDFDHPSVNKIGFEADSRCMNNFIRVAMVPAFLSDPILNRLRNGKNYVLGIGGHYVDISPKGFNAVWRRIEQ
ncbi:hypothetical protein [Ferrimonas sp. SCSIO 43195]|uniref:hypothetical protein n=1 Tax=Ferrimonas sp. SCSIO 43195 TaxID=2822844 RepID=UPI002075D767|nr:hypothetical protein [Ferrimonas sp. SCSIO 43195]USD35979.1 hypothetical protein J8Z22_13120 [Ferrimonas sp. SCSIO 43195]